MFLKMITVTAAEPKHLRTYWANNKSILVAIVYDILWITGQVQCFSVQLPVLHDSSSVYSLVFFESCHHSLVFWFSREVVILVLLLSQKLLVLGNILGLLLLLTIIICCVINVCLKQYNNIQTIFPILNSLLSEARRFGFYNPICYLCLDNIKMEV